MFRTELNRVDIQGKLINCSFIRRWFVFYAYQNKIKKTKQAYIEYCQREKVIHSNRPVVFPPTILLAEFLAVYTNLTILPRLGSNFLLA